MVDAKWAAMTCVRVERRASIVTVRLNRPEKMNAINSTMEKEFYSVLADCDRMDEVKCVVLTAEGANFSSGHDVQQVAAETIGGQEPATIQDKYWVHTGDLLPPWRFSKGLVVATKGYVGPHANTFLLAADVVIAADNSRFSWEESRVGVGAPYGPYALMPFHFPIRRHEAVVDDGRLDGRANSSATVLRQSGRPGGPRRSNGNALSPSRSRAWKLATSWPTSGVRIASTKRRGFRRWSTLGETPMSPALMRQWPRTITFG